MMENTTNREIYFIKNWLGVVFDEGHKIKNEKSQTNVNAHLLDSLWRLLLTGMQQHRGNDIPLVIF